jgi:hypothetical protein
MVLTMITEPSTGQAFADGRRTSQRISDLGQAPNKRMQLTDAAFEGNVGLCAIGGVAAAHTLAKETLSS